MNSLANYARNVSNFPNEAIVIKPHVIAWTNMSVVFINRQCIDIKFYMYEQILYYKKFKNTKDLCDVVKIFNINEIQLRK